MTKARDLADIISDGFTASDIPSLDASKITTGTLSTDRYVDNDTVYTHPTTAGNKHVPSGGATDQILTYSSSGTASWAAPAGGDSLASGMIRTNGLTISENVTFTGNENGVTYGPVTVGATYTVTVTSPSVWHVL